MMGKITLVDLYSDASKVVVTAHRGCCAEFPENTMGAFQRAAELGVDIIEFDLRSSRDHVPVVLHDGTVDRTSNGSGPVGEYSLAELQEVNFSCWDGVEGVGQTLDRPMMAGVSLPTFEDVLQAIPESVGLNIQVYETDGAILQEICRLYGDYDLYGRGYLTLDGFAEGDQVRGIDPDIDLCILHNQGSMTLADLDALKNYGSVFIQP